MMMASSAISGDNKISNTAENMISVARLKARPRRVMGRSSAEESICTRSVSDAGISHSGGSGPIGHCLLLCAEISFHHHLDQLREIDFRAPSQEFACFAGISTQIVDLGRTHQLGIDFHVLLPVEPGAGKCGF